MMKIYLVLVLVLTFMWLIGCADLTKIDLDLKLHAEVRHCIENEKYDAALAVLEQADENMLALRIETAGQALPVFIKLLIMDVVKETLAERRNNVP